MKSPAPNPKAVDFIVRHRVAVLGIIAGLALVDVFWLAATYLVYPGYLDHGEPSVALISWRLLDGAPAFLSLGDPALVSNVYGPLTYAVHAVSFCSVVRLFDDRPQWLTPLRNLNGRNCEEFGVSLEFTL